MHLTKSVIDRASYAGDGQQKFILWDSEVKGFGVRVYPSGDKSYVVKYRCLGRQRLMVLGGFDEMPLSQARDEARQTRLNARKNIDTLEDRRRLNDGETMADLCRHYLQEHAPKKKSGGEDKRRVDRIILPRWGSHKVASITRTDVARLHADITRDGTRRNGDGSVARAGAPYEANRTVRLLAKMFELARQWGYLEESAGNPAKRIQLNAETKRDRYLSLEEAPRFLGAVEAESNIYVRAALLLYLLTGLRRSELLDAKWEALDCVAGELRIPQTKANRPHVVYLSADALAVIQSLPKVEDNPYIFVGKTEGERLVNIGKAWARVARRMGVAGDTHKSLRIHDLRHTFASWLAAEGKSVMLIRQMLNHSDIRTTMRYVHVDQQSIKQAMREHSSKLNKTTKRQSLAQIVSGASKLRLVA